MTILPTTGFLRLLLILLPLMKPALAVPPPAAEAADLRAHLPPLQPRAIICNPEGNPNLNLQHCHSALQQIPRGLGIGPPLGGMNPSSPYYLPRDFIYNDCRIVVQLGPERDHAMLSWASVRYRASLLVNLCVGGLGAWAPGFNNNGLVPGRSGNATYGGVQITVDRI